MYSTGVCPFCLMAERLLKAKGVTEIEKVAHRAHHPGTMVVPRDARIEVRRDVAVDQDDRHVDLGEYLQRLGLAFARE